MRDRGQRRQVGALSIFLLLVAAAAALAQESQTPAELPLEPAPWEGLTAEAIRSQQERAAEATDLNEETEVKVQDLYQQALEQLRVADDWAAKLAGFESAVQEAPTRLEAIKAELAKPPVEPMPEVPADASLTQLEQLFAQVEADLSAAQKQASDLDTELKRRGDRRAEIPKQVADAQQRLSHVTEELTAVAPADEPVAASQARRTLLLARKNACEQEIAALEKEILSYDARGELLTARCDQAARRLTKAQKMTKAWQNVVAERRRQEAERAAQQAKEARLAATQAHPAVRDLAEENARLTEQRTELALIRLSRASQDMILTRPLSKMQRRRPFSFQQERP